MALSHIVSSDSIYYHLLITIGIFGLVASFHGIILAAGRATYEFSKEGYLPSSLAKIDKKFYTPKNALLGNMIVGIVALLTGQTGSIIILACFGAVSMYIISMLSFFALKRHHPTLERPFKTPLYPWIPGTALVLSTICLGSLIFYNFFLFMIFLTILMSGMFLRSINNKLWLTKQATNLKYTDLV